MIIPKNILAVSFMDINHLRKIRSTTTAEILVIRVLCFEISSSPVMPEIPDWINYAT